MQINDNPKKYQKKKIRNFVAKNIDFSKINELKTKIGLLGEELVFHYLLQDSKEKGTRLPIHVSKEEGDGLGYDIRSWDEERNEIHIEVKTTKSPYSDGFEITAHEVESSLLDDYKYFIYRVYNLDIEKETCDIKIYEGPVTNDTFQMNAKVYKIYQK